MGYGAHLGGGGGREGDRGIEGDFVTCIEFSKTVTCVRFKLDVSECTVGYIQKYQFFTHDVNAFPRFLRLYTL
jgi:hypothetical protein